MIVSNAIRNNSVIAFLLMLLLVANLTAQENIPFKTIGVHDGLSQSTVIKITQDHNGFIWMGTQDGLNRYDGSNFKIYRHSEEDSSSLSNNYIMSLACDSSGNIWAGTTNGLNKIDGRTGELYRMDLKRFMPGLLNYRIPFLCPSSDKKVFFTLSSEICYADSNGHVFHFAPGGKKIKNCNSLFTLGNNLYFTTNEGLFRINPAQPFNRIMLNSSADNTILAGNAKNLICKTAGGLISIGLDTFKSSVIFGHELQKTANANVVSVNMQNNDVWVCTENGLIWQSPRETIIFHHDPESPRSLSSDFVYCVFTDRSGHNWIGTSRGGACIMDPAALYFRVLGKDNGVRGAVWNIAEKNDTLVIGTSKGLVVYKKLKAGQRLSGTLLSEKSLTKIELPALYKTLDDFLITSVAFDKSGNLWAGTENNGVFCYDFRNNFIRQVTGEQKENGGLVSNKVLFLDVVADSIVAVTSPIGVSFINPANKSVKIISLTKLSTVFTNNYTMKARRGNGLIWFGTSFGAVAYGVQNGKLEYHFIPDKKNPEEQYHNIIADVTPDGDSAVWIATLGYGLVHGSLETRKMQRYSVKDGLRNPALLGLLTDNSGRLWMGSHEGISFFDRKTRRFQNFGVDNGLGYRECTVNGFFKSADGDLYFGTVGGLVYFNPDSVLKPHASCPTVLTGIKVNYSDELENNGLSINGNYFKPKQLNLDYRVRSIHLDFACLDFLQAEHTIYFYRLLGFSDKWVRAEADAGRAVYTNLAPGTYTFNVVSVGEDKLLPGEMLNVIVVVTPPFWKTWWFIVVSFLTGLTLLVLIINYFFQRKLRIEREQAEQERKIQREKERISRELHDNVGSQLTYIIRSLDTMSFKAGNNQKLASAELEALVDFSRETLNHLRESIWAINSKSIPLSELISRIQDYINKISVGLREQNITLESSYFFNIDLKTVFAINCFRIVQEAIVNSVKYSGADSIQILILQTSEGELRISVQDNGCGFELQHAADLGHGLSNMKSRAAETGAELEIRSSKNNGTTVTFSIGEEQYGK